ncbi:hypothetical protein F5Y04DRAFT_277167 [Hypomontagnella monticulosa]|nr:hypothetical protein F5Y04DRAFT_277167 [Hypomontagnella monticulosa]
MSSSEPSNDNSYLRSPRREHVSDTKDNVSVASQSKDTPKMSASIHTTKDNLTPTPQGNEGEKESSYPASPSSKSEPAASPSTKQTTTEQPSQLKAEAPTAEQPRSKRKQSVVDDEHAVKRHKPEESTDEGFLADVDASVDDLVEEEPDSQHNHTWGEFPGLVELLPLEDIPEASSAIHDDTWMGLMRMAKALRGDCMDYAWEPKQPEGYWDEGFNWAQW